MISVQWVGRTVERLMGAAAWTGVAAYAAAALVTVADIIGRRAGFAVPGVVDLVQLFVLGGAWMCIPYAFAKGAHVAVDVVVNLLPAGIRRLARLAAGLLALALMALTTYMAFGTFAQQAAFGDRSQQLGIPITWYWAPVIGGLGLSVVAILLRLVSKSENGEPATDG